MLAIIWIVDSGYMWIYWMSSLLLKNSQVSTLRWLFFCCEVLFQKSLKKTWFVNKKLLITQHFPFSVFQQAKQIQDWLQPSITPPSGHLVNRKASIGTTPLAKDWLSNLGSTKTKYVCPVMTPISSEDVQRIKSERIVQMGVVFKSQQASKASKQC